MVFHVVFAIMGMLMFSDTFGSCTDDSIKLRSECYEPENERQLLMLATTQANVSAVPLSWVSPAGGWGDVRPERLAGDADDVDSPFSSTLPMLPAVPEPSAPPLKDTSAGQADDGPGRSLAGRGLSKVGLVDARTEKQLAIARGKALNRRRKEMGSRGLSRAGQRRQLRGGGGGGGGGREEDLSHLGTVWINPAFGSFDDFASAMLILYISSTGDGWEDFMWAGMDATGPGMAPERNDFSSASIFFLLWMVVGSFVALNLFVGAIVDNFTRIKQEDEGSATMTPEQQQWVQTMKMANSDPSRGMREPTFGPRKLVYQLIASQVFEFTVMSVIGLNIVLMALDYNGIEDDENVYWAYNAGMQVFTYFYYCEFALKFFAMGFRYFQVRRLISSLAAHQCSTPYRRQAHRHRPTLICAPRSTPLPCRMPPAICMLALRSGHVVPI